MSPPHQIFNRAAPAMRVKAILVILPWTTSVWGQVVINEVMQNPSGSQGIIGIGTEYVELYNTDPCYPADIGCFILGCADIDGLANNAGAIRLPAGTTIPPLGYYVVGTSGSSADPASVDFKTDQNTSSYCAVGQFILANGDGWVALYDPTGLVQDALFWTVGAGEAAKVTTDGDFDDNPCTPQPTPACSVPIVSLPSAKEIALNFPSRINYGGQTNSAGRTFSRIANGAAWSRNILPSINDASLNPDNCNNQICTPPGVCCTMSTLTAVPSACAPATNSYTLSGQVTFSNAPASGTLTISTAGGGSVSFSAPFTSPLAYTITGLNSTGGTGSVTAVFSASESCTLTTPFTIPAACSACSISGITANPSACDGITGNYSLSGQVIFSNAPSTGTLNISGSCGSSQIITAPFASPVAFSLSNLPATGSACTVTATFSAVPGCTIVQNYMSPVACVTNPCVISSILPIVSGCDEASNTFSVTGQVLFNNAPATGSLTVSSSCGGTVTINAPFTSAANFSLSNLTATGAQCQITAAFSDQPGCSKTQIIQAPQPCGASSDCNPPNGQFVVINEVMHNPSGSQGIISGGTEYVELYNPCPCSEVDIGCYILGTADIDGPVNNRGSIVIPPGTVIPPLGHYVIGTSTSSSDPNGADFKTNLNTANYCAVGQFVLANGDGWVALYQPDGTVADAVYWTFAAASAGLISTDSDFDDNPCAPPAIAGCGNPSSLLSAKQIFTSNPSLISYAGQGTSSGVTFSRISDGGAWQRNIAASINDLSLNPDNCNGGACVTATPCCTMIDITANAGACQPATSTYSLSGQVTFSNPPASGSLTISSGCGQSVLYNAPFSSPLSYTISGLGANGQTCSVNAVFSDSPDCIISANYLSPAACSSCVINSLSAQPGGCNTTTNNFSLSGQLIVSFPPATGNLAITTSCGGSVSFSAPFGNIINYVIPGLPSNGAGCTVSATFTAFPSCTFSQSFTAPVSCAVNPCDITSLTASPGSCDGSSNEYSLNGTVVFQNPPLTGTLTLSTSCGGSVSYTSPFTSPLNYAVASVVSNGSSCTVTAVFSSNPGCSMSQSYTSPQPCVVSSSCESFAGSGVLINEVMPMPAPSGTDACIQSLANTTCDGKEYVELYNSCSCNAIDISCFVLASMTTSTNGGAFTFPPGTIIPPLGHLVIGGANASATAGSVDIVLNDYIGTPYLCLETNRWYLENTYGWIALFDPAGAVVDAVYWTFNPNSAGELATDSDYDWVPCTPSACNAPPLIKANQMNSSQIYYAGDIPSLGKTLSRQNDGESWGNDINPSIAGSNNCNIGTNGLNNCESPSPPPTAVITNNSGSTLLDCNNTSVSLTASGGITYSWSNGLGNSPNVTVTNPGTYTVTVTAANGCEDDELIVITQNPVTNPTVPALGPYCEFDTPDLLPTSSLEGISGTWIPGVISTNSAGSTFYTFIPDPAQCATQTGTTITVNTFASCQLTPVELLRFDGRMVAEGEVLLEWQTESEINNDYFDIERSENGISFYYIGRVQGSGNSNSLIDYSYTDHHLFYGTCYYRLRQVDYNGTSQHSHVIAMQEVSRSTVRVHFDPSGHQLVLTGLPQDDTTAVYVLDTSGRIILRYDAYGPVSRRDFQGLSSGVYLIHVLSGTEKISRKIAKATD